MRVIEEMIEGYYSKSSPRNELINPDLKASANGTKKSHLFNCIQA